MDQVNENNSRVSSLKNKPTLNKIILMRSGVIEWLEHLVYNQEVAGSRTDMATHGMLLFP